MTRALKNFVFVLFVAVGVSLAGFSTTQGSNPSIIPQDALIVDVRTPLEFRSSHYPNATNIPLRDIPGRIGEFGSKDQPIVVYCRSGRRSGIAKELLTKSGYTHVTNGGGLQSMMQLVSEAARK